MLEEFKEYLKSRGVTAGDVAQVTGYSERYIVNLLNGSDPINDRARFRLMKAFPDCASMLLASSDGNDDPAPDPSDQEPPCQPRRLTSD